MLIVVSLLPGAGGPFPRAGDPSAAHGATATQVAVGRAVYLNHCARCHGEQGEGIDAPALMGESSNRLQGFLTAASLYRYLRFLMPLDDPGGLPEEDYWAVLAYLLVQNGVIEESVPVGPDTAEQIAIKQ